MNADSRTQNDNWRPLALMIVAVAAVMVVVIRLIPYEHRLPNFAPVGALFLFVGARMRPGCQYLLPFGLLAAIDLYFLGANNWRPNPWVYGSYALYLLMGWFVLRNSESPIRVGGLAIAGSAQFFLITNFGVWLSHVISPEKYVGATFQYPPTFAGLMECYDAALPFYRGTLFSDVVFTGAFFAAHAILARKWFPVEQIDFARSSETQS
jgi:hypothetical protein